MISHWMPKTRLVSGVVTEVRHVRDWTPTDRYQKAEVVLDGGGRYVLLGQEPEEFFLRKPRRRTVDRDDVASLKIGDRVELRQLDEPDGLVTHLNIVRQTDMRA